MLRHEAEPEFDLRQVARSKAEEVEHEVSWGVSVIDPSLYTEGFLWRLANARLVERGLGLQLISPEKNERLDLAAHNTNLSLNGRQLQMLIHNPESLAQLAAWVQCYPEEREKVAIDNKTFVGIFGQFHSTLHQESYLRKAVFLLQLFPDERERLRRNVTAEHFQQFIVDTRKQEYLLDEQKVEEYMAFLADYLLIHPEDRDRFSLTPPERQIIQRSLRKLQDDAHPTVGKLRDAAIIFAEDAQIDDRGVIEITYPPSQIKSARPELPARSAI